MSSGRVGALRDLLKAAELDALIVSSPTNIRYLTGFTGSNGTVAITLNSATLITDSRYTERANEELAAVAAEVGVEFDVVIAGGLGRESLATLLEGVPVIGLEADDLSWSTATALQQLLSPARLEPTSELVEGLRELKSDSEVELIRKAAAIADAALTDVVERGLLGSSEREVQRALDRRALELGADGASFDTIVASGPNGSRPHHEAGDRVIESGDLVIIDFGAEVSGYRSDMTRSFVLGQPTSQQQTMLDAVHVAQAAGVDAVSPGVVTSAIDEACRAVLAEKDLGKFFTHGTGHGVGLDIHEAPSVNSKSTATLAPGHVITVEPGVYIPEVGGVRWEDTVLVTEAGAETLTNSPKQPLIDP